MKPVPFHAYHLCEEKLKSEDKDIVVIRTEIGKDYWYFHGFECKGPFHIFHCPFCGIKLKEIAKV